MSELRRESLRNVAIISSAGAGKTSLAEAASAQFRQYESPSFFLE
jgi:Ni2+-binding GTPase involved in maturation of urease and hydrogenase